MNPWCQRHWSKIWTPAITEDGANGILGTVLMLQKTFESPEYEKVMRMVDALFPPEVPRSRPNPQGGAATVNPQIANLALETLLDGQDGLCDVMPWGLCQNVMREAGVPESRIPVRRED